MCVMHILSEGIRTIRGALFGCLSTKEISSQMGNVPEKATLSINGNAVDLPVTIGREGEEGRDISQLRSETKAITFDPGYGNTGSCESAITFIDGEKGILRYRGYAIEDLTARATFSQVAYLLIYGEFPNPGQLAE